MCSLCQSRGELSARESQGMTLFSTNKKCNPTRPARLFRRESAPLFLVDKMGSKGPLFTSVGEPLAHFARSPQRAF